MKAMQVKFFDHESKKWLGGIMVDDKFIICGCCGGVFEVNEIDKEWICPMTWVDISEAILGEN